MNRKKKRKIQNCESRNNPFLNERTVKNNVYCVDQQRNRK